MHMTVGTQLSFYCTAEDKPSLTFKKKEKKKKKEKECLTSVALLY